MKNKKLLTLAALLIVFGGVLPNYANAGHHHHHHGDAGAIIGAAVAIGIIGSLLAPQRVVIEERPVVQTTYVVPQTTDTTQIMPQTTYVQPVIVEKTKIIERPVIVERPVVAPPAPRVVVPPPVVAPPAPHGVVPPRPMPFNYAPTPQPHGNHHHNRF